MKRIISLAASLAVLVSLSACRAGNVGMDNRNNGITNDTRNQSRTIGMDDRNNGVTNGGTNFGRTSTINNNNNNAQRTYRDGVYTNFGNGHSNGNERAIVTIRNGRIANIDLASVSQQEATNYGNTTGTRTGNQGTNNNQLGNFSGTNTGIGTGTNTGIGGNNATGIYNGVGTGTTTGINNRAATGIGTGTGINNTANTGIGQNAGNTAGDTLSRARTTLVNAMIQNQTDNVTIDENDTNARNKIDNWKLAVSRALDQARR